MWGNLGLVLMDGGMLSNSLIQFSADGQGCVPTLFSDLRQNSGGGNEKIVVTYFKRSHACTTTLNAPDPAAGNFRPTPPPDSWTITGTSGSVSCGVTAPFSWVLVYTKFCLCPPRVCFPVLCKFCNQIPLASKVKFPGDSQSLCQISRLRNLLWILELS